MGSPFLLRTQGLVSGSVSVRLVAIWRGRSGGLGLVRLAGLLGGLDGLVGGCDVVRFAGGVVL